MPTLRTLALLLFVLGVAAGTFGCVARAPVATQCVFNGDCAESLICAGGVCRAECNTDRDCPMGTTCVPSDQIDKKVCLPPDAQRLCVYSSDCTSPLICSRQGRCSAQCLTDWDCRAYDLAATCQVAADGGGTCSNHPVFTAPDAADR